MRKVALTAAVIAGAWLFGCATHDKSAEEVRYQYQRNLDSDMRSFSQSWNKFWLADRPYPINEWHQVHD
jgi:hypothetical protein